MLDIREAKDHKANIETAFKSLAAGQNAIEIPGGSRLWIAKKGTPEAQEREAQKGIVLYEREIEGIPFFVCRK